MGDVLLCSAKGCRAVATWSLRWNNPKLHPPERRKTWLACPEHRERLADFLSARGFLREVTPVPCSATAGDTAAASGTAGDAAAAADGPATADAPAGDTPPEDAAEAGGEDRPTGGPGAGDASGSSGSR